MKSVRLLVMSTVLLCAALLSTITAVAQDKMAPSTHVMVEGAQVKWGAPPPVLAKGAQFAVLSGDPGKAGPFVINYVNPADDPSKGAPAK